MTSRIVLRFALAALVASTTGCPTAFDALATPDAGVDGGIDPPDVGGAPDTGPGADAGDDAAFVDAGPGACAAGVRWIDPVPEMRSLARSSLALTGSAAGFELFFHDGLDGTPTLLRVPTSGAAAAPIRAGWADPTASLFAGSDELGTPSFATWASDRVRWAAAPASDAWTSFDGELAPPLPIVGDVAFTSRGVLVESYQQDPLPSRVVTEVTASGAAPIALMDPVFGNTFQSPRLAVASGVVWDAMLSSWDRPRSVQLGTTERIFVTNDGCVVDSFDIEATETVAAITQDCSSRLVGGIDTPSTDIEIRLRGSDGIPGHAELAALELVGPRAEGTSSRIARSGGLLALAYRGIEGAIHVVVYRASDLSLLTASTVPGADLASAEDFGGPFDIAAHDDGTFAVAWTHAAAGSSAAGALQRFRACE